MKIAKAPGPSVYTAQSPAPLPPQESTAPVRKRDLDRFTASSAERPSAQKPSKAENKVAEALRKQYPWATFTFTELGDRPEDIAQFAVSAGGGIHLAIDPDMLDWMAQGPEAWAQGFETIHKALHDLMLQKDGDSKGAVIADDGETTFWTAKWEHPNADMEKDLDNMLDALDRIDEARKKQEGARKKLKLEEKKKLNYQMGKDMARLAKGTTDRDVRSLISSLYANRQKIACSSSYNKREIQMALAQMDHVIRRARAKLRHLKDEGDMQLRIRKAEKQKEEKRRLQLERELKERKRSRIARERAAIHEKLPDLPGLRDEDDRREARAEAALKELSAGAGTAEGLAAAPTAAAGSTVVVSVTSGASVEVSITPMA